MNVFSTDHPMVSQDSWPATRRELWISYCFNKICFMNKASLDEKFALIHEHWRPKVVAQLNGQEVKLVKLAGVFPWHQHEHEDEMFLVWRGQMTIEFRDRRWF